MTQKNDSGYKARDTGSAGTSRTPEDENHPLLPCL
jgi:hypothetical protein